MNTEPSKTRLRIATRKSQLAVWQAEFVKQALEAVHPQLTIEIHTFSTEGDRRLDVSLSKIGLIVGLMGALHMSCDICLIQLSCVKCIGCD